MITASIYELSVLLMALAFVVFIIVLIPSIIQLKKTIKSVEDLAVEGKKTVENVNQLIKTAGEHGSEAEAVFKRFVELSLKIAALGEFIADSLKSPLISVLSVIFGIETGLKRFMCKEKKGGGGDEQQQN